MEKEYFDEHKLAKFIFHGAENVYELHDVTNRLHLSDVDFIVETEQDRLFIEYKNSNVIKEHENINTFNSKVSSGELQKKLIRKYWDSLIVMQAIQSDTKNNIYEVIIESDIIDKAVRKRLKKRLFDSMVRRIEEYGIEDKLIKNVMVFNTETWKKSHPEFVLDILCNNIKNTKVR